jgi:DNA-binding transcriptional ArsR family regulator
MAPIDEGSADGGADAPPQSGLRQISDARTLRALAHPVRIALIEALSTAGAMTATEVGEMIGESPSSCSFHLRQLAKYGFVEEAEKRPGRSRPWRMTSIGFEVRSADDPEAEIAMLTLLRLARERQFSRYRAWLDTRASYPKAWQDAAGDSEYAFFITAEELEQLNSELYALLIHRFEERRADPSSRPPGSVPVEMLLMSYPLHLPKPG